MKLRRLVLLTSLGVLGLGFTGTTQASAEPIWNLDLHHHETNFAPGETGQYWVELANVGDTSSSGPITLKVTLPNGITRDAVLERSPPSAAAWSCPGSAGDQSFTCTSSESIPSHTVFQELILSVKVAGAEGTRTASAKVKGGNAAVEATTKEPTPVSTQPASFGVVAPSFVPDFFTADGVTTEREAGAHPDLLTAPFDFNSVDLTTAHIGLQEIKAPAGNAHDLHVDTPPGFIGNPTAVGECTQAQFTVNGCPSSSQVGRIDVALFPPAFSSRFQNLTFSVYNLSHPRGVITDLGFSLSTIPVHIKASLDPANRYAIVTEVSNINEILPPFQQKLTLWGIPADPSHDSERCPNSPPGFKECPTDFEPKAFLSLPSQCDEDNTWRLHHYDSWQDTGDFGPDITYTMPEKMTDCDKPRFEPEVEIEPTGKQANTPTGIDVHIKVPQNDNPNALATPPVKRTVVTLPEGMSFSPSFADGLQSCSLAQIKLFTNDPIACPPASRIGEVELSTPLLPKSLTGSMYLAAQGDNPFQSTFALYMVLEDTEERGTLLKIPGKIDVDPTTGQITTTFDETPQFPFGDLTLKFRSGPRAPLVNPPACGSHTIGVQVSSYAQPTELIDVSNTYQVSEGPNGTPCPPDSANRPFSPEFSGGTLNPVAGTYSTFLFRLSRDDSEQELSQVTAVLPPGLVAKLAGIPFCPEAALGSISAAEGAGRGELNNPACPAASQLGTISAGLGAGPGPNYFGGKVYLAGPYKGAPLSLAVVAPGIAGPFDLGNVVVRAAIRVNPETAQVTAVSDPFPTILQGVILRARDIRLRVDRPETTINPTSCAPMALQGQISGVGGNILTTADDFLFTTSHPFQVGSCASLGFKPKLSFRLYGGTKRGGHPRLKAMVRMPAGGANIAKASVALPRSEFLDQSHIGTVCTRVQFAQNNCPAASVYGKASVKTPLLDEVLSGPIYLRSSENLLPDLVVAFRGGRVDFNLVGRIDSVRGGIRNTFDLVPDAPVTWAAFDFLGGKKGLLENSRDLCKHTYRATAKFRAQNGEALTLNPEMQNSCKKARKGAKRRR